MRTIALVSMLLAAACAGQDGLTAADKQNVMNSLTSTMNSGTTRGGDTGPQPDEIIPNQAFSHTIGCPAGGHITISGNITIYTNAVTYISTVNYGDRSNNLYDCQFGNGLVIDGTLYMNITAYQTYGHTSINGSLELARKGPSNGLIPLDSCFINLVYDTRTRVLSGSVCGDSIYQQG
ncbi:MAG: hypothetical protein ACXWLM_01450 [Myxococcales bacterium]